jgi:hypothetical protein
LKKVVAVARRSGIFSFVRRESGRAPGENGPRATGEFCLTVGAGEINSPATKLEALSSREKNESALGFFCPPERARDSGKQENFGWITIRRSLKIELCDK